MYKNLLLCLDGSPQDEAVLTAGLWFAKQLQSSLHGLHVKDLIALEGPLVYDLSGSLALIPQMNLIEETRKAMEMRGNEILKGFRERCEAEKVNCTTSLEEGVIHRVITNKAQLHDLTILGRRGLSYKLDQELLGSTADRVIRKTNSPVLVLTHAFDGIRSPLLAYDGSPNAREAMVSAVHFLSLMKLPLTVLHVNADIEDGKAMLAEAKEYLDAYDIPVKYDQVSGVPRQEIPAYAKKHRHDLMVLGARGHRGLVDLLLGSTTEYALWQEGCHLWVDR